MGISAKRFEYPQVPSSPSEFQSVYKMFRWIRIEGNNGNDSLFPPVKAFLREFDEKRDDEQKEEEGGKEEEGSERRKGGIFEPRWAMLLQNKAMLVRLFDHYGLKEDHRHHRHHQNHNDNDQKDEWRNVILRASYSNVSDVASKVGGKFSFVCKSIDGVNGDKVVVVVDGVMISHDDDDDDGKKAKKTKQITHTGNLKEKVARMMCSGVNDDPSLILQEYAPCHNFAEKDGDHIYAVLSTWIVDGKFAGCVIRESNHLITTEGEVSVAVTIDDSIDCK